MEAHVPQTHQKSKRWKEYLLECIMIFVAVSMGFIAENIRETLKDKETAHELAISLVKDLTQDTSQLKQMIRQNETQTQQIDSMYLLLQKPFAQIDFVQLQHLIVAANNATRFGSANGTTNQLISTGALRLFIKTKIPGMISIYQHFTTGTNEAEIMRQGYTIKFLENFISKHFTPENSAHMNRPQFVMDNGTSYVPLNNKLRNFSEADATQLSTDIMLYQAYINSVKRLYEVDLQIATGFIMQVNTEMHLEKK